MEDICELRGPIEQLSAHRANAASFSPNTQYFYRHNTTCLEVWSSLERRPAAPFAVLLATDLAENDFENYEISLVTTATIAAKNWLVVCTRDTISLEFKIHWWDPYELKHSSMDWNLSGSVSCIHVTEELLCREQDSRYQLLLVGMTNARIATARIVLTAGHQPESAIAWETNGEYADSGIGMVTAIASYTPTFDDDTEPIIAVGSSNGHLRIHTLKKRRQNQTLHLAFTIQTEDKGVPGTISKLLFCQPERHADTDMVIATNYPMLFAARGQLRESRVKPVEVPEITGYRLDIAGGTYQSLQTIKIKSQQMLSDGSSVDTEGGKTLAMSLAPYGDLQQLIIAFSVRLPQNECRAEIITVKISGHDIKDVQRNDWPGEFVEAVMDIAPQKNSDECSILLASKIATYTGFVPSEEVADETVPQEQILIPTIGELLGSGDVFIDTLPYSQQMNHRIIEHRKALGGRLFYDELLLCVGAINESVHEIYPPKQLTMLTGLIERIYTSTSVDLLKRHCLIYYLLKDMQADTEQFLESHQIPRHFQTAMDGYWDMDHGEWENAVSKLADPSVEPDWAFRILQTLHVLSPSPRHAYLFLHIAQRHLLSDEHPDNFTPENLRLVLDVTIRMNLSEAFVFARKYAEAGSQLFGPSFERNSLLRQLLDWCFSPPFTAKREYISHLLALPFNATEESFLSAYCTTSDRSITKDFLLMYYVHRGKYPQAILLYDELKESMSERDTSAACKAANASRAAIIENLTACLPGPQREALKVQMELRRERTKRLGLQQRPQRPQMNVQPPPQPLFKPIRDITGGATRSTQTIDKSAEHADTGTRVIIIDDNEGTERDDQGNARPMEITSEVPLTAENWYSGAEIEQSMELISPGNGSPTTVTPAKSASLRFSGFGSSVTESSIRKESPQSVPPLSASKAKRRTELSMRTPNERTTEDSTGSESAQRSLIRALMQQPLMSPAVMSTQTPNCVPPHISGRESPAEFGSLRESGYFGFSASQQNTGSSMRMDVGEVSGNTEELISRPSTPFLGPPATPSDQDIERIRKEAVSPPCSTIPLSVTLPLGSRTLPTPPPAFGGLVGPRPRSPVASRSPAFRGGFADDGMGSLMSNNGDRPPIPPSDMHLTSRGAFAHEYDATSSGSPGRRVTSEMAPKLSSLSPFSPKIKTRNAKKNWEEGRAKSSNNAAQRRPGSFDMEEDTEDADDENLGEHISTTTSNSSRHGTPNPATGRTVLGASESTSSNQKNHHVRFMSPTSPPRPSGLRNVVKAVDVDDQSSSMDEPMEEDQSSVFATTPSVNRGRRSTSRTAGRSRSSALPEETPLRRSTRTKTERTILTIDAEGHYVSSTPTLNPPRSVSTRAQSQQNTPAPRKTTSTAPSSKSAPRILSSTSASSGDATSTVNSRRSSTRKGTTHSGNSMDESESRNSSLAEDDHSPAETASTAGRTPRPARKLRAQPPPRSTRRVTRGMAAKEKDDDEDEDM